MLLALLRHGIAIERCPAESPADDERPLTRCGRH